jgi:hypothetical protein
MIDFAYVENSLDELSEEQSRQAQSVLVKLRNAETNSAMADVWNSFMSAVDARRLAKRRRAHAAVMARSSRSVASV